MKRHIVTSLDQLKQNQKQRGECILMLGWRHIIQMAKAIKRSVPTGPFVHDDEDCNCEPFCMALVLSTRNFM